MENTYEDAFEDETVDLVEKVRRKEIKEVRFRDKLIRALLKEFDNGRSILLVGPKGVGKTALVHGLATIMRVRAKGGLRQLSTATMLAGTRYLGDCETKATSIAEDAEDSGSALYFDDVWNLATTGKTDSDPTSVLDVFRPLMTAGRLVLVGEATQDVLRQMERVPGFVSLFRVFNVPELDEDSVDGLLEMRAQQLRLEMTAPAKRALLRLSSRFLPAGAQPGPALALMEEVRDYQLQKQSIGESEPVDESFIGKVFSIYSGLPRFIVSPDESRSAQAIRDWFSSRIVGQREAIENLVETITLFKSGLNDPDKPLGTFLFVGPTGVGKTEVARALAEYLFGSAGRLLRFDLSEFKDYHSFQLLVGNPEKPAQQARLLDPVRAHPFQVVLFDELEKAHQNVWDLFLQLLDEGRLSPPVGSTVDFRNTIIIATSNVGAQESSKNVGFGADPAEGRASRVVRELEKEFRPEFLNRFSHITVFHSLDKSQLRAISRIELKKVFRREGIADRNLAVDIEDALLDELIDQFYNSAHGARGLKRMIQQKIVLPLAMTLMEKEILPGAILKLKMESSRVRVRVLDTEASRMERKEIAPVKTGENRKLTKVEILDLLASVRGAVVSTEEAVNPEALEKEVHRLSSKAAEPDFWSDSSLAARTMRDLDRCNAWLDILFRLREAVDEVGELLDAQTTRRDLEFAAGRLESLRRRQRRTHRELAAIGVEGMWDAVVILTPLGELGPFARDEMFAVISRWAKARKMTWELLCEPMGAQEPAILSIHGAFAYGYLRHESGLHRFRKEKSSGAVKIRVVPWKDGQSAPEFGLQRALKAVGLYGNKVRSRVEVDGGFVLQNKKTIVENRELAGELTFSLEQGPPAPEEVVRRVDLKPFLLRDFALGLSTGRPGVLQADGYDEIICERVDLFAAAIDQ